MLSYQALPCLPVPQTFDNGVICASEQSVVVVDQVRVRLWWMHHLTCGGWLRTRLLLQLLLLLVVGQAQTVWVWFGTGLVCLDCLSAGVHGGLCVPLSRCCRSSGGQQPAVSCDAAAPLIRLQVYDAVREEFATRGAYFLNEEEREKVRQKVIVSS